MCQNVKSDLKNMTYISKFIYLPSIHGYADFWISETSGLNVLLDDVFLDVLLITCWVDVVVLTSAGFGGGGIC